MKKICITIGILVVVFIFGCTQQLTKYVCSNGATVSDISNCPKQCKSVQVPYETEECGLYFNFYL